MCGNKMTLGQSVRSLCELVYLDQTETAGQ